MPDKHMVVRRVRSFTLIATVLLIGAGPAQHGAVRPIEVLRVGSFHGHEVTAKSGEDWFGLFPASEGFELRKIRVHVDPIADPLSDRGAARTGVRVSVEGGSPLLLVRGIPHLKAGPVPTMIAKPRFFYPGERTWFQLTKGNVCTLTAYGNVDRPPDSQVGATRIYAYRLVLTAPPWSEENQQDIVNLHGLSDDSPPRVIWAGDLDGDGRLDLFAEIGNHYNVTDTALYLSSQATGRQLVQLVARFRSVGC